VSAIARKALGKALDAIRIARWVRRHDVVIVPGTGILEAALRLRPWGTPYVLFLLCRFGQLFGTKVALVSVGADETSRGLTRWFFRSAVASASYTSFRDANSRDAMRGVGAEPHPIYPDLVFGVDDDTSGPENPEAVGVGVMAYYGTNDDRAQANQLHAAYAEKMGRFVEWLLDGGRPVRLLVGDSKVDEAVAQGILTSVKRGRPGLEPGAIVTESAATLEALLRETALVGTVVAARYHNVLCALKLSKPTISIGYSEKHDTLMAAMGLGEFCQSCRSLDVEQLIGQFAELQRHAPGLRQEMAERNRDRARQVDAQFSLLSSVLFGVNRSTRATIQA
jgi:polysaccharide pyruvyl transferase WcaK-like protein